MRSNAPQPIIIILPEAGGRWIGGTKIVRPSPIKPQNPHRPIQHIPQFDRRALRERVNRLLKQDRHQREGLRALAHG
jgi:hypothetical protein